MTHVAFPVHDRTARNLALPVLCEEVPHAALILRESETTFPEIEEIIKILKLELERYHCNGSGNINQDFFSCVR